ncbi:MAG TPA: MFS transporter [Rhodocyclaceae bacterium]|nr:MFS transporter [Rhodocyclaceae bacterium]
MRSRDAAPGTALSPLVRRLIASRAARSVGQGALAATFTLYLHALHWSAPQIGAVLGGSLLFGAALTLGVGSLSDRLGRKQFLLGYELVLIICALLAMLTTAGWALALAAVLSGFGRGANGAAGPFGPLEQAWLSHGVTPLQRARVFSLNSTVGFAGMAAGALLGALPPWLGRWLPGLWGYRALFLLPLAGSALGFFLISGARDLSAVELRARAKAAAAPRPKPLAAAAPPLDPERHRRENGLMLRLGLVNALNGLGIGMVAPLMAYWYAVRYGHGPASIGPAMAASFVLAAIGSQLAGRLAQRAGVVDAVVGLRAVGLLLLLLTPLAPAFWLAATLYALRAAANQGTLGVRQALTVSLTGDDRRGLAAAVNNVSVQIPRAIGPLIAGLLLHAGWLLAPFFVAGSFQAAYLVLYRRFFHGVEARRKLAEAE